MSSRRIRLALPLALAALCAGCGGVGASDVLSVDPVASAATKTEKLRSMRVAFSGSVWGPWEDERISFAGTGVVDAVANAGRLHFKFVFPPLLRAQIGGSPSMDMIVRTKPRIVMYMRSRLFASEFPSARPWLKVDLQRIAALRGVNLRRLAQLDRADPGQNLAFLRKAGQSRELSWDRVRGGLLTKRYGLTLNLRAFDRHNPRRRIHAEVWIDERGYLRKLAVKFSLLRTPDGPVQMRVSEEFFDFGVDAHVVAPPASQVTDATKQLTGR